MKDLITDYVLTAILAFGIAGIVAFFFALVAPIG